MFRNQCNVIGFFLLIGLGIAVVCSSQPVVDRTTFDKSTAQTLSHLDVVLDQHRLHLAAIAKRNAPHEQFNQLLAKMNLALDLLATSRNNPAEADRNRLAALRIIRGLPAPVQRNFLRELAELTRAGGEIGAGATAALRELRHPGRPATILAFLPHPGDKPHALQPTEGTQDILDRLNRLRATRANACPSGETVKTWQDKISSALNAERGEQKDSAGNLRHTIDDFAKAQGNAIQAEEAYRVASARALKDLKTLYQDKERLFRERDRLRDQTQILLAEILPPPAAAPRAKQQIFNAAISMIPVFGDYQRRAPLWRYDGLDVRSSEAKIPPERFGALDSAEFQRYFVEPLKDHPQKDFAFTLTEEGRRALSRPFFPIGKIAVHRLAELDAAQEKSRQLFAASDRVYAQEKAWEDRNRPFADELKAKLRRKEDSKMGVAIAGAALTEAEQQKAGTEIRLKTDEALRGQLNACFRDTVAIDEKVRVAPQKDLSAQASDDYRARYYEISRRVVSPSTTH